METKFKILLHWD